MTDEQWVDVHAANEDTWRVKHNFRKAVRPKN